MRLFCAQARSPVAMRLCRSVHFLGGCAGEPDVHSGFECDIMIHDGTFIWFLCVRFLWEGLWCCDPDGIRAGHDDDVFSGSKVQAAD